MEAEKKTLSNGEPEYELKAPDGGWGYVVAAAVTVILIITLVPIACFGLIFGDFLKEIGDETEGTTWTSGTYNTINSFTGLLASALLNKYSCRQVGLLGSILYVLGTVAVIFAQNLVQLVLSYGVLQGIGFGLILPAAISGFNDYFDKKLRLMMIGSQTIGIIFNIGTPSLITWCKSTFGYRWTLVILAGICVLCIPAMAVIRPVEKYRKKVPIVSINSVAIPVEEPLMEGHISQRKKRTSVVSVGDNMASVTTLDQIEPKKPSSWKSMDFSLLKSPRYLNISIGLGLCFTGDIAFITIAPMILTNLGFVPQQIAYLMAIFFGCDLLARVVFTVVSYFVSFRSRIVVLVASGFIVIARAAFAIRDDYLWKLITMGVLGFLRCFILSPIALVFAEEYSTMFTTSFSLSMVVGGCINLAISAFMNQIKKYTGSDFLLSQILTLAYAWCVVSWIIELTCCRKSTKDKKSSK